MSQQYTINQYNKYMSQYTHYTLEECYSLYLNSDNKKLNKEEEEILEKIRQISNRYNYDTKNPFVFRFLP